MGIIIYLVSGIIAEAVVMHYLCKRTAIAFANDPNVVFHYDNETTNEHLSISSVNVDANDKIVKKVARTELSSGLFKEFKWWHIITNLVSLCTWPISMICILVFFDKQVTDEDIVNDLLLNK